jgi:hypothetical protein
MSRVPSWLRREPKAVSRKPFLIAALLLLSALVACRASESAKPRAEAIYSKDTGKLSQLAFDSNHDGKLDTWSYMDGARALRIEIDKDGDGKIDRWEYYGANNTLEKVGFSRSNDGQVDAWAYAGPDGKLERVEISTARNGKVTRTEYYENEKLVRAEEDSLLTGAIDKWETYANGALASVSLDTTHRGRPDRKLIYGPNGTVHVEQIKD